jgi:hypothetical protein
VGRGMGDGLMGPGRQVRPGRQWWCVHPAKGSGTRRRQVREYASPERSLQRDASHETSTTNGLDGYLYAWWRSTHESRRPCFGHPPSRTPEKHLRVSRRLNLTVFGGGHITVEPAAGAGLKEGPLASRERVRQRRLRFLERGELDGYVHGQSPFPPPPPLRLPSRCRSCWTWRRWRR